MKFHPDSSITPRRQKCPCSIPLSIGLFLPPITDSSADDYEYRATRNLPCLPVCPISDFVPDSRRPERRSSGVRLHQATCTYLIRLASSPKMRRYYCGQLLSTWRRRLCCPTMRRLERTLRTYGEGRSVLSLCRAATEAAVGQIKANECFKRLYAHPDHLWRTRQVLRTLTSQTSAPYRYSPSDIILALSLYVQHTRTSVQCRKRHFLLGA